MAGPYKITWKPSPNKFAGRAGQPVIAIVNHRMVGYLPGTDIVFANPANDVSTHFGIGFRKGYGVGPVEISQYVDLADGAWGNGNYDPSGGWTLVRKASDGTVINPNYYTISIEHEDGATANDGIVLPEVRAASEWLTRILLTGNMAAYAAAGIRCSSQAVADQIGAIVPGNETYIDHNRIAGTRKPYCWRAWLGDGGFVPAYKPTMLANVKDTDMAIDDIMVLLQQEIDKLEAERDAAVAAAAKATAEKKAAQDALAVSNAKLDDAKAHGAAIVAL